jgi:hypothetical protein
MIVLPVHERQAAEIKRLQAENERLRAALRECPCPGGGFNGMPEGAEPTIGLCIDHGVCGCSLGEPLQPTPGRKTG